jgi:hypothetical protein
MPSGPVFIVGVGRSGTTLLRLMLHHHPEIAIPYESHFIDEYYDHLADYGDLHDEANLKRLVDAILAEPLLKMWDHTFTTEGVQSRIRERSLSGVLNVVYEEYAAGKGKTRWGDKSDYLDRMYVINELFPNAQFIHIIRDGRDVARSVLKLPWGPNDIIRAAEWWERYVWLGRRTGRMLGKERYAEVKYEDLLESPERELRRLCQYLRLEFAPSMLEYYRDADQAIPEGRKAQHYNANSPVQASRAFSWKREMDTCDIALFDRHAGSVLQELGYERPPVHVGKLRLGWRMARILLRRTWGPRAGAANGNGKAHAQNGAGVAS